MLFPTLFGWNKLVDAQSERESFWLALVVMLHVGSALGLLGYFWRDWIEIVRAFFRTLSTRRIETSTERLAWLIVVASVPAGILGLALEHAAHAHGQARDRGDLPDGQRRGAVRGGGLPPPRGGA